MLGRVSLSSVRSGLPVTWETIIVFVLPRTLIWSFAADWKKMSCKSCAVLKSREELVVRLLSYFIEDRRHVNSSSRLSMRAKEGRRKEMAICYNFK